MRDFPGQVVTTEANFRGIGIAPHEVSAKSVSKPSCLRCLPDSLRQICSNAGDEAAVILNKIEANEGSYGYNARTSEYGDMIAMGILDPTKVTRSALQNAASVAGLLITTEAMIAELPKEAPPAMPGGDMGGMGGMGGMM